MNNIFTTAYYFFLKPSVDLVEREHAFDIVYYTIWTG